MPDFNSKTIALENHNLVEASAGTGKTFSIAILVVRVIIENGIPLNKLLMVTFTNAAVAELEIRIRRFIRQAYGFAFNENAEIEPVIKTQLNYAKTTLNIDQDVIRQRLQDAVQSLDELNVMTIHSFCQDTLKEFSFETNQLSETEIITDESELFDFVNNEFWRQEISTLDTDNLKELIKLFNAQNGSQISKVRKLFAKAMKYRLEDKKYVLNDNYNKGESVSDIYQRYSESVLEIELDFKQFINDNKDNIQQNAVSKNAKDFISGCNGDWDIFADEYYKSVSITGYFLTELIDLLKAYSRLKSGEISKDDFEDFVSENIDVFEIQAGSDKNALDFVAKIILKVDVKGNLDLIEDKFKPAYIRKDFSQVYAKTLKRKISEATLKEELKIDILNLLFLQMFKDYSPKVSDIKNARNQVSYDDLILKVHKSKGRVKDVLSKKYDILFIDEFQDTDKNQYEIFSEIFASNVIFYIGDPKQSIYGWRKADLNTYKKARTKVGIERVYEMNTNFRSTPRMLDAMNLFFKSIDNVFNDSEIIYHEVNSGTDKTEMTFRGESVIPVSIYRHDKDSLASILNKETPLKDDFEQSVLDFVASETYKLLNSGEYLISGKGISPTDIGILVRTNYEAKKVKDALSKKKIPAITLDDTQVLKSPEASHFYFVMQAVNHPTQKSIYKALLNNNFGLNTVLLAKIKQENILQEFSDLKEKWKSEGIYGMLSSFMEKFDVRNNCFLNDSKNGQRSLSNYYQIMEILHDFETRSKLDGKELISKFSKAINGILKEDEYIQRLESDENAVKIITIHKSKGLQYNIVFAPFLDFPVRKSELIEYRDPDTGEYCFALNDNAEKEEIGQAEVEQENRRLIYVAITRSVYKCFININYYTKFNKSSIKPFITGLSENSLNTNLIEIKKIESQDIGSDQHHNQLITATNIQSRAVDGISQLTNSWNLHSFSSLSHKHEIFSSEALEIKDPYDCFVFNEMPKGANAGLFLHSIFEHLDFTTPEIYTAGIESSGAYYSNVYREEHKGSYLQLVQHCMDVIITNEFGDSFSLKQVSQVKKLPELEFYFSLDNHQKSKIADIIPDIEFSTNPEIEGMMHGFIDLFFEYSGKYYILDWKSNFLGNTLNDYNSTGLSAAMKGNNYHLQYYIYTVAVNRWLKNKISGFDYEKHFGGVIYLFLRGVRNDNSTGVFYAKPALHQIENLEKLFHKRK